GLVAFVGIVASLPFGVIPVQIAGAQLTLIDAVMIATFSAVLARALFGGVSINLSWPGPALLAFTAIACVAFIAGGAAEPIPPELFRRFGKLLASVLFFFIATALLTTASRMITLARALIVGGAVQGALGTLLMLLSPATQLTLLSALVVVGYPSTEILRYVPGPNNTYTTQLRAIGTSVDPNVFGGTLMLALVLAAVQLAASRPVLPRFVLFLLLVPIATGVVLSLSRASWLGLGCGLLLAGCLRYRRIIVVALVCGVAVLVSPVGQDLIARFIGGFSAADPATAFRLGEYFNAVVLIQRYPWLGIGFGLSPDIDVTAGVSSVYLLVAEQTGLLGLLAYLLVVLGIWWRGARNLAAVDDRQLQGLRTAYLAAITGALVTGTLDHYFANIAFPHAVALFWLYAAGLFAVSSTICQVSRSRSLPWGESR
ncbi:MAG: O-antigen ligase family protein, partial [Chloroflexi bacterium]|nr:O-antigen ligase family protein [Chloroflexota bacterium]